MNITNFHIDGVLKKYPLLVVKENIVENETILEGIISFDAINCDTRIRDSYNIEIVISNVYPKQLPVVREIGGRIKETYKHMYSDRSLCLATEGNMHIELQPHYDLLLFIDKFIVPYFFTYSYYEKYRVFPYGERSHGAEGILEYYMDYFGLEDIVAAYKLLQYTCKNKYRGHDLCPCGSLSRIRNCHMESVRALKSMGVDTILEGELTKIKEVIRRRHG